VTAIREAQERAWANKQAKGFNVTDVPLEFCFVMKELGEAFDAWRLGNGGAGEEIADAVIFLLGLAQMTGSDADAEVAAKLAVNDARAYERTASGALVKSRQPG
jgi:NTP pyrophosphatase (non-canonical NTP hydrolase)